MKHDCDIVRDLMPMCIDGTASEKAKTMVDEHVKECPPCDKVYAEMKGEAKIELPVQSAAPEFVTTVKKMKKRRKRRTWLALLLGVIVAGMMAIAASRCTFWYFEEAFRIEDAQLTVVFSKDGMALIHASNIPQNATMHIQYSAMSYPEAAKGLYEGYAYISSTRHEARTLVDDVYFVLGYMEEDAVIGTDRLGNDLPVYRLLLGRNDGSGQIFYLADEDQPQQVSIKGAHLKSLEHVGISGSQDYYKAHSPFVSPTPMPVATLAPHSMVDMAEQVAVYQQDGTCVYALASPTPDVNYFFLPDGPTSAFITDPTEAPIVESESSTPTPMPSQQP